VVKLLLLQLVVELLLLLLLLWPRTFAQCLWPACSLA
jgi:hypothetical protein